MDMFVSSLRFWIILLLFGSVCILYVNSQAFSKEPQDATVDQGATHVLDCTVNKTYLIGYFFVAWIRETEVIAERNVIEKSGLSKFIGDDPAELNRYAILKIEQGNEAMYNLRIEDTKGVDAGNYQCVICSHPETKYVCTNITEFKSQIARYTVKYTPSIPEYPECTGLDSSGTVSVGTVVEVTCKSQIGDPKVNLVWNSGDVQLDGSITEREDSNWLYLVYTFTADLAHTGAVLTCSSTSSYFPTYDESCSFNALNVVDKPVVTLTSGAPEYEVGSQANFTCKVSSATSVTFDWTVGNIPNNRYTQVDTAMNSVITINSVDSSDHLSVIRCEVTNTQGQIAQDQVILIVIGGPTGIIPTSMINPPTTKSLTTKIIVETTPGSSDAGGNIGAIVGGALAAFVVLLLVILIALYCKKRKYQKEKDNGKIMSIGAPQNGIGNNIPPAKKIDYDDDLKKEPLPISDEPDVVPRQHNGNHDPRSWWRESMPGDAYKKDDNEYPTIKRMQMPFTGTQRQPSLENLQERVEMDNYPSSSNDYDDRHSERLHDAENLSSTDGRYDYNPTPSIHSDTIGPQPTVNNYHDYHNPQFDHHPDNYYRPPSVNQYYSSTIYHEDQPTALPPMNYGAPPHQDRYDNSYRDYGSYDRRNPANYGPRPGIDNPSYKGDMYNEHDMYNRNPNYTDSYDPHGYSEDGSVFSSATDRYYDQEPQVDRINSPAFYPDNNGYVSSDRPISPYADIPHGQSNNSSDVLYMQGHDLDLADPSYV